MNEAVGVDWSTALLVLAGGLVLGTALVWRVFGRSRAVPAAEKHSDALEIRDLEGKCSALVAQLRELEDTASKRTGEQLARERYALELQAAQALLALEMRGARPAALGATSSPADAPAPSVPGSGASPNNAALRGFLWGTTSAGALALLFFFLYTQARPREAGGSLTGAPGGGGMAGGGGTAQSGGPAGPAAPAGAEEKQIRAAIALNPNDLDAHLELARVLLGRQDMMGVWNETKLVLERSPGNPRALSYQALVRLAMGQSDKALEMLKESLAKEPNLVDSYVHLALVYVRLGRVKEAQGAIAEASRRFPDQAAGLQKLLADLQRGDATADTPPAGAENPHASVGTPGGEGGAPAPHPAAGGTQRRISGTVDLDPSLKGTVSPSAVLFVFVREAGFGAGPPVAAKRLPASAFPIGFEVSESDAMMGQTFPDALLVEARLDADGDPTTRPPTDPKARQDDVKIGSTDTHLVLKRP